MPLPVVKQVDPKKEPFRVLLYGDPGAGKTSLAVTADLHPAMSPALIVNFDGGLSSVSHLPNLQQVSVTNNIEMMSVLGEFTKPEDKRAEAYQGIKTVIIDSLTAWRDQTMQDLVRGALNKGQRSEQQTQIQDYAQMTLALTTIIHGLKQTPLHLIITAGIDEERTPDGSTVLSAQPLLNPKLWQSVNYMMSNIWFARKKGDETYRLLTLPRGIYSIKTRNPRFVSAIKAETRKAAPTGKEDAAEGWWDVVLDDKTGYVTPNISTMYDLYLKSQGEN